MENVLKSKSQTLITGVYRTGSEYLSKLINTHPQISSTDYAVNIFRFSYNRYDPINEKSNYLKLLTDTNQRLKERYFYQFDFETLVEKLEKIPQITYGALYDLIMQEVYLKGEKIHWAEKNQLLWREIPLFIQMMRNPKTIHIIRDPRSVLASFKKYTNAPSPLYLGAIFNCYDSMKKANEYLKSLPSDQYLLVRYEDLAANPIQILKKCWKFIGVEESKIEIDPSTWKDAYGNPWFSNSSFHQNNVEDQFDSNKSIARWRGNLSQDEIDLTEFICFDYMQSFGYETKIKNDKNNVSPLFKKLAGNSELCMSYYERWSRGEGIQEFPSNPLDRANWETGSKK